MLAHTLHHPKRTLFIATCTVFSLLLITVSEGDAQLFRKYRGFSGHGGAAFSGHGGAAFGQPAAGSFWQGPSVAPQAVYSDPPVHSNAHPPIADLAPASRLPKWPFSSGNSYDPRVHLDADRFSRYPKFIGGFHSSHFTDVGLPTGDKGFRSNGIYWTPW